MKPIVIITAVPLESQLLVKALEHAEHIRVGGCDCLDGSLGAVRVILCCGGVGKVNAAAATAVMIERYQPRLVINAGCAGAYSGSSLEIGNLVVASEEVLADDGVIVKTGWQDLRFMNIPVLEQGSFSCFNVLPLSRHASEKAMQLADYYGVFLMRGRCATVSTCSGTTARGEELQRRWGVIAESMEGGAVAQICLRYGVDCLEIRGISNQVEDRDMKKWDIVRAVESAQRFVLKYLEELERPELASVTSATPEL